MTINHKIEEFKGGKAPLDQSACPLPTQALSLKNILQFTL